MCEFHHGFGFVAGASQSVEKEDGSRQNRARDRTGKYHSTAQRDVGSSCPEARPVRRDFLFVLQETGGAVATIISSRRIKLFLKALRLMLGALHDGGPVQDGTSDRLETDSDLGHRSPALPPALLTAGQAGMAGVSNSTWLSSSSFEGRRRELQMLSIKTTAPSQASDTEPRRAARLVRRHGEGTDRLGSVGSWRRRFLADTLSRGVEPPNQAHS